MEVTLDELLDAASRNPHDEAAAQLREQLTRRRLHGQAYTAALASRYLLAGNPDRAVRILALSVKLGNRDAVPALHDAQTILLTFADLGTRPLPANRRGRECSRCPGAVFTSQDIPSGMCLRCRFLHTEIRSNP